MTVELQWDYCECGCKCFVAKGTDYSIYLDLNTGKFTLFESYWRNQEIFDSYEGAQKAALERFKEKMGWS